MSSLRLDPKLALEGRWVDYEAGIRLKVARWGNDLFEAELRALARPRLKEIRAKTLSAEALLEITLRAAAKFVLVGWENIEDDEGKPIPYTPDAAFEFFSNPDYGDFYRFVRDVSNEVENYRRELVLETVGN